MALVRLIKFILRWLFVPIFTAGMTLVCFFLIFAIIARDTAEQAGLPTKMENGLKHSYAAEELYHWLRFAGVNDADATHAVLWLGIKNEYLERAIRHPIDSTPEVAKDLYNDYVGILAGRWWYEQPKKDRDEPLTAIVTLARAKVIAGLPEDIGYNLKDETTPNGLPDVDKAVEWFDQHKGMIENATLATLKKPISRGT